MAKLEFTKQEQTKITNAIMAISEILLLKMDEGLTKPEIEGTIDVNNEDKELMFSFAARRKSTDFEEAENIPKS